MKAYSNGRVHVMAALCDSCVFRPGNLMQLRPGRLAGMTHDAVADDSAIICHSTLYGAADQEAVCRGFFDRYPTLPLRLAVAMDLITFTDLHPKE